MGIPRVNLLPPEMRGRPTMIPLLVTGGILVAIVICYVGLRLAVAQAERRLEAATAQRAALQPAVNLAAELQRLREAVAEKRRVLNATRPAFTELLNLLARHTPYAVRITRIDAEGGMLTIEGRAVDLHAVAQFLDALQAQPYLDDLSIRFPHDFGPVEGAERIPFLIRGRWREGGTP